MKYSYVVFPDETEITYSDIDDGGNVEVHIETPVDDGFNSLRCKLPSYEISESIGYNKEKINYLMDFLHRNAHLIIEFARTGGFDKTAAV